MFFSNLITFFIIIAAGATLFANGITQVQTVGDAMQALALFGSLAPLLFALGIIGTGLLAIPVLAASSAYAFAEAFHWREGLGKTFTEARGFYAVICTGIALGCIASLLTIDAVTLLLYSGFCNALLAPIVLFFVIRLSSHKRLMRGYHSSRLFATLGWVTLIAMALVCGAVLVG
jgi:Mn2+/Fe2+ NRAMP family transporter